MVTDVGELHSQDIEAVRRAKGGDVEAFSQLVHAYQRRAISLAYRLLGNADDAADVSQDAFVRTFRGLDQLDDPAKFGPWLLRTVGNLALNFRRARKLRSAAPLDDAVIGSTELRSGTSGLKLIAESADADGPLPAELRQAIDVAMRELPEKQRLALILFSVEGMPQKDVAEVLECSVELVKWNVFQARKKLRELLKDYL